MFYISVTFKHLIVIKLRYRFVFDELSLTELFIIGISVLLSITREDKH